MTDAVASARAVVALFAGPALPWLLPYELADAVGVLVRSGEDADALAARMSATGLRIFVRAAAAHVQGAAPERCLSSPCRHPGCDKCLPRHCPQVACPIRR